MATFPNLRKHRNKAGLSQAELHRKSGVSRDIISGLENGKNHTANLAYSLLNTLNDHHFSKTKSPLDPDAEVKLTDSDGAGNSGGR